MTATLHTADHIADHIDADWANSGPHVPNYHLRRTIAVGVVALLVVLAAVVSMSAVGALTGLGGRPAAASETLLSSGSPAGTKSIHVAESGDSLWSIAGLYRGDIGRDRYIDALIALNGGTAIQAGQAIHLP